MVSIGDSAVDEKEQYLLSIIQEYHDMYEAAVRPYVEQLIKIRSIRMEPLSVPLDLQGRMCAPIKEEII